MSEKTNQRITLTKRLLKESLALLLHKKELSKITISELCENAGINRSTFYKHFGSQYDVMREIEDDMLADISKLFDGLSEITEDNIRTFTEKICDYLQKNKEYAYIIGKNPGSADSFFVRIFELPQIRMFYETLLNNGWDSESAELIYAFFASGSSALVKKWLFTGKKSPREISVLVGDMFKSLPEKISRPKDG